MRILDGTPSTPQFLTLPFVQVGGTFPINRARTSQTVQLNRDVLDTYTHWVRGSDSELVQPLPVTFTAWLEEQQARAVIAALSNPYRLTPWLVGTATFLTASATGASIINGAGGSFLPPQFTDDPLHVRVHVEHRLDGLVSGTNATVFRHEECFFPPNLLTVSWGEQTTLSATYWIYGRMSMTTVYTTGVDRTPAVV
jgi:hypothetical protein